MKTRIRVHTVVIDDDPHVCAQARDLLEAEGFDVSTFSDPIQAVQHVYDHDCDIALVDLRLPDTDSAQLIRAVRERSPITRILILAAFPEPDAVRRALDAGANDLFEKPLERTRLLESIDRQLDQIGVPGRTEKHFNRRLGGRLRELRHAAQRTQNEVARGAGITAAQLSQIELGKTATTTWTLARICRAMNLPLSEIFTHI